MFTTPNAENPRKKASDARRIVSRIMAMTTSGRNNAPVTVSSIRHLWRILDLSAEAAERVAKRPRPEGRGAAIPVAFRNKAS
jgi:hypothetical protein